MNDDERKAREAALRSLETVFQSLNSSEAGARDDLRDLQVISQALFAREGARLAAKLGVANPRVLALEARVRQQADIISDLDHQRELAAIRVPEAGPDAALIHGRIVDEDGRGLAGMRVALEDPREGPAPAAASVTTDAAGYYAIRLDPAALAALVEKGAGQTVLAFRSPQGRLIHREAQPLAVAPGAQMLPSVAFTRRGLDYIRPGQRPPVHPGRRKPAGEEDWRVSGRVLDPAGKALPGLLVKVFDRDVLYDDLLGAALTDNEGSFVVLYRRQEFREGREIGPDLYLTVSDAGGQVLYTSSDAVRLDAGRAEEFEVTIDLGGGPQEGGPVKRPRPKPPTPRPE